MRMSPHAPRSPIVWRQNERGTATATVRGCFALHSWKLVWWEPFQARTGGQAQPLCPYLKRPLIVQWLKKVIRRCPDRIYLSLYSRISGQSSVQFLVIDEDGGRLSIFSGISGIQNPALVDFQMDIIKKGLPPRRFFFQSTETISWQRLGLSLSNHCSTLGRQSDCVDDGKKKTVTSTVSLIGRI